MSFKEAILALETDYAVKHVTRVGKGVRALVDMADPSRIDRAGAVASHIARMSDDLVGISGAVRSQSGHCEYIVGIEFGPVASSHCSCPDFGRTGPCKHVLAIAITWVTQVGRPTWVAARTRQKLEAAWVF